MSFNKFVKACKKYGFTFNMYTFGGVFHLTLHQNNTYKKIEIKGSYNRYDLLFLNAVKKMKEYKKRGK